MLYRSCAFPCRWNIYRYGRRDRKCSEELDLRPVRNRWLCSALYSCRPGYTFYRYVKITCKQLNAVVDSWRGRMSPRYYTYRYPRRNNGGQGDSLLFRRIYVRKAVLQGRRTFGRASRISFNEAFRYCRYVYFFRRRGIYSISGSYQAFHTNPWPESGQRHKDRRGICLRKSAAGSRPRYCGAAGAVRL